MSETGAHPSAAKPISPKEAAAVLRRLVPDDETARRRAFSDALATLVNKG